MTSLIDKILGTPLASSDKSKECLNTWTGVPLLGLDALASLAYGPEAALAVLAPLGIAGLHYMPAITLIILALLAALYVSYRQTIAAYPNGGGAYVVAKENLGNRAGLLAASALLVDYTLNVAVGISAGIAAIVSAFPVLHRYMLGLCLLVLAILTVVNLRGVRESGIFSGLPTFAFVGAIAITVLIGFYRVVMSGGHPVPVATVPQIPPATQAVGVWLLLRAFASGCTAMTGVEAVSNGVPLFRKPAAQNARRTLTLIVAILGVLLLGIAFLCRAYHIGTMDQHQQSYQTILSQLIAAVAGRGVFYYVAITSILIILTFSANTSFAGFPRVCRLLAEDSFLPMGFANLGRRLVFSMGIGVLAILSGIVLIAFDGVTDRLIPLFAVGAFSAFTFSQAGMVVHWRRQRRKRGVRTALILNLLGAISTAVALVIMIVAKFAEGAWLTLLIIPGLMALFQQIESHYGKIAKQVESPVKLKTGRVSPPIVIIPIDGWNRVTERALRFGLEISDDITALHITTDDEDDHPLREIWAEKVEKTAREARSPIPRLKILSSPYRQIYQPILEFVGKTKKEKPDRLVAVIIPQLIEPHWYQYLLHNQHSAGLRAVFLRERDQRTVVITTPWYLRDD